jgi:UDP-glucose 4-epimerase
MATYLVTGAAGFIGAALAQRLLDEGNQVITVDNLSTGVVEHIPAGCELIEGDTYDVNVINQLYKYQLNGIFHIAGQSGGMASYDDPVYDMNSNIASTLLLLDYARKTGCNKLVYASSMSVYGDENPCPVLETSTIKPKSFYAVGKMASEHYLRIYASQFGIKCTALRLNNVYGPGQNLKNMKQGMASIFVAQAIKNKHIHSLGSKDRYRDFVYVDDVVDAFIKALDGAEKNLFNVYTIATNRKTTVEQLVNEIKKSLPFEVSVKYEGSTPGDQFGIYCSYELINKNLGWDPHISLENGLKNMISWALKEN